VLISGDYWQTRTEGPARRWLQELLAVDPTLNRAVNAYSIHPYPDPKEMGPTRDAGDPSFTFAGQIRLARETDPSLPIWVTEVGWSTASTSDSVSEATQASYVREATRRAIEELNVARFFNYMLRDTDGTSREDRFGLRRADGSAKAAWDSLAALLSSPTSGTSSTTTAPSNTTTTTSAQTTTTSGTTTASPATTYGNGKAKGKQKDAQSPRLSFLSLRARVTRPLAVKRVPRSIRLSPGHRKPTLSLPSRRLTLWGRVRTKGSAVSTRGLKVSIYLRRAHGWRFLGARRIRARGRFGLSAPFFGRAKVLRVRVVIRGSDGPAGSRVRTIAVRR
jgi:hypothetical protein